MTGGGLEWHWFLLLCWGYRLREAVTPVKSLRGYGLQEADTLSVGNDLPRDNRYSDYDCPDRSRQCSDQHDGGPQGQGVFGVFHAIFLISNRSAGQLNSGPH